MLIVVYSAHQKLARIPEAIPITMLKQKEVHSESIRSASERVTKTNKQTLTHSSMHTCTLTHTYIDISSSSKEVIPLNLRIRVLLYMGACRYANITYQIWTECTHAGERARASRTHKNRALEKWKRMNAEMWNRCSDVCVCMCSKLTCKLKCVHIVVLLLQQLLRLGYTPALHLSFYWCHLCKSTEMMNVMHSVIHIARDRDRDKVRMTLT